MRVLDFFGAPFAARQARLRHEFEPASRPSARNDSNVDADRGAYQEAA
jgi:hypothetical protein